MPGQVTLGECPWRNVQGGISREECLRRNDKDMGVQGGMSRNDCMGQECPWRNDHECLGRNV